MPTSRGARPGWTMPGLWIRRRPMSFSASAMGWRAHRLRPSGYASGWRSLGRVVRFLVCTVIFRPAWRKMTCKVYEIRGLRPS